MVERPFTRSRLVLSDNDEENGENCNETLVATSYDLLTNLESTTCAQLLVSTIAHILALVSIVIWISFYMNSQTVTSFRESVNFMLRYCF